MVSVPIRGSINLTDHTTTYEGNKYDVMVSVPIRGSINLTGNSRPLFRWHPHFRFRPHQGINKFNIITHQEHIERMASVFPSPSGDQ